MIRTNEHPTEMGDTGHLRSPAAIPASGRDAYRSDKLGAFECLCHPTLWIGEPLLPTLLLSCG